MKTLILSALLAISSFTAHAQIAIWKMNFTETISGAGSTGKLKITGYLVMTLGTNADVQLVEVTGSTFSVETNLAPDIETIATGVGRTVLAITIPSDVGTGSFTIRGPDVSKDIAGGLSFSVPNVFTFEGAEQYYDNSNLPALEEWSGTAAFDKADTATANNDGLTMDAAVADIVQILTNRGLTQSQTSL